MHSTHYAGADVTIKIGPNEPWKKVYGPVFAYVNSLSDGRDPLSLWKDAKKQVFFHRFFLKLLQEKSRITRFTATSH